MDRTPDDRTAGDRTAEGGDIEIRGPETTEDIGFPVGPDRISGTVWHPVGAPRGVIMIHPATATPRRYYRAFASCIAASGIIAMAYDYRGTGESGDPRDHPGMRMRDWMSEDVPAAAAWCRERFPDLPHAAVGHSIGGHAMVLGHGLESVSRFAVVSAHVAATQRIAKRRERLRVGALLTVVGPVLCRTLGYMPGRRLGLGEDIPAGAMLEWGRWTRLPGYFYDGPTMHARERAGAVEAEVLAIGADDDLWASPEQMDALLAPLHRASVERRTYAPAELGVPRLGHHGLLRRGTGEAIWPDLIDWLSRDF